MLSNGLEITSYATHMQQECNKYINDMYRTFSEQSGNVLFCFTAYDVKVLLIKMNILFFQIQQFWDSDAIIEKHQNNLIILIVFLFPNSVDFSLLKFISVILIWILLVARLRDKPNIRIMAQDKSSLAPAGDAIIEEASHRGIKRNTLLSAKKKLGIVLIPFT